MKNGLCPALCPVAFALGMLAFALPQTAAAEDPSLKRIAREQRDIRREIDRLEEMMLRLASRLEESQPYYAQKLRDATKLVREHLLKEDIEKLADLLEAGLSLEAIKGTDRVVENLLTLLAFLEDRKDERELQRKLEAVRKAARELGQIQKTQQDLRKETDTLAKETSGNLEEFQKTLQELAAEQQRLLAQHPEEALETLAKVLQEAAERLGGIARDQKELSDETKGAMGEELEDLGKILETLGALISRQQKAAEHTSGAHAAEEGYEGLRQQIAQAARDQRQLAEEILRQGAASAQEPRLAMLAKGQQALSKLVEGAAQNLLRLPDPTPSADRDVLASELLGIAATMGQAAEDLRNETPSLAEQTAQKAAAALEKPLARLEAAAEQARQEAKKSVAENKQNQQGIREDTQKLAASLDRTASTSASAAGLQALSQAGENVQEAASAMQEALDALASTSTAVASKHQGQAVRHLHSAREALERLFTQLAQRKKPQLDQLARRQADLEIATAETADQIEGLSRALREVRQESDRVEGSAQASPEGSADLSAVARAEAEASAASSSSRQAASSMGRSEDSLSRARQDLAAAEQKKALEALHEAIRRLQKLGEEKSQDELERRVLKKTSREQEQLAQKTSDLAKALEKAARQSAQANDAASSGGLGKASEASGAASREMKKASSQMQGDRPGLSRRNQQQALQELQKARAELEKLARRAPDEEIRRKLERLARRQRELEEKLRQLENEVEKIPEKKAAEHMQTAASHMGQAASQAESGQPSETGAEQDDALEELERAMAELDEARRQYQNLLQEQVLVQMENEIQNLLEQQKKIRDRTNDLEADRQKAPQEPPSREHQIRVRQVAKNQSGLGDRIPPLREKLKEEGSLVFDWTLGTVQDDVKTVTEIMEKHFRTDEYTQGIQEDIERKLKELLEALKRERARRRGQGGGGGGGGHKLVPDIAELKLLRQMQMNCRRKTEAFSQQNLSGEVPELDPVHKMILERLAAEQGNIAEMTREFTDRLKGRMQGN